jgi:hypothetical protein
MRRFLLINVPPFYAPFAAPVRHRAPVFFLRQLRRTSSLGILLASGFSGGSEAADAIQVLETRFFGPGDSLQGEAGAAPVAA